MISSGRPGNPLAPPLSMTPRHSHSTDKWRSRADRQAAAISQFVTLRERINARRDAFQIRRIRQQADAHDNLIAIYYGDMVRRPQRPTNLFRERVDDCFRRGDSMHSVECGKRRDFKIDQPDCTAKPDAGGCGDFDLLSKVTTSVVGVKGLWEGFLASRRTGSCRWQGQWLTSPAKSD